MELKTFFAQDLSGNVIPSPTVNVYQPGTTTRVTGLQMATGAALSNPFTGTTTGQITLAAPDGTYDLAISGGGRAITMRVRFVAVTSDGVALAQAAAVESAASASDAEAAQVAAEAARDSTFFNSGRTFATTAAGLAGSTDGQQFAVVEGDYVQIYTRTDASTATIVTGARYATASLINDLLSRFPEQVRFVILPPESGWLFGVVDDDSNLAIAVDTAGKTWLSPRTDLQLLMDNMPQAVKDLVASGGFPAELQVRLLPVGFSTITNTPPESGFVTALTDQLRRVGWGIKPDGTFWAKLADDVEFPLSLVTAATAAAMAAIIPSPTIECWGDSMTAGAGGDGTTYPNVLASLLGRTVNNRGIGGQTSPQIITRQGGLPLTITVSGNQIPASGGVAVTAYNTNILRSSGVNQGTNTGTLAGVPGTLSTDLDANWTFTRTTAGSVVSCPAGSVFTPDLAAAGRDKTVIFWVGRNDANATRAERLATLSNALAGVDYLDRKDKRVLVISVCNSSGETSGSTAYNEVIETNEALQSAFGDCFLDVRKYLIDYGLADAGITPTSQDLTDIAADVIPSSLRSDSTHFTAAGYTLVANFVARAFRAKGW